MIIVLNGPLGIGKSTLSEALMERLDASVMLDGDQVVAVNPPPADELRYLHSTLALLVKHHLAHGYRHFVINHIWHTAAELDALRQTLSDLDGDVRCFRLVLPFDENLRRIRLRQSARAIDEQDFEMQTVVEERAVLEGESNAGLGEPFDVSGTPDELVSALLIRLGLCA
jgi:hypothetical protein